MSRSILALLVLLAACDKPPGGDDEVVDTDADQVGDTQIDDTEVIDTEVVETDTEVVETDTDPVETDTDPVETDTVVVETDTDPVETDTVVETDTEVVETDTVVVETDTDPVETDTVVVETDTLVVETDTEAVETDTEVVPPDADGDGYADAVDCAPGDPSRNPGAPELCDGVDQDCDGVADEDAANVFTYYVDVDGDGYGGGDAITETGCALPPGVVVGGGDCDDGDSSVNPGAPETCNSRDDDCDGAIDDDPTGASTWYPDGDGDGYGTDVGGVLACEAPPAHVAQAGDCDDGAAGRYPGASETCDGVDQDCDGTADDDATDRATWYADADADGHGDAATATTACEQPDGYAASGDDCDDDDATAHPGAVETCDGADDDCDGTIDDAAIDARAWYADFDADGYGDPAWTEAACEAPADFVADATDCDDGDALVSPGADEVCNEVDDDCDGETDEAAIDGTLYHLDFDEDGFGDPAISRVFCAPPPAGVLNEDDCDDADATVNPDAEEVCDDVDQDCDGTIDDAATDAPTWYADADADGHGDGEATAVACEVPDGFVGDDGDCDDADADVHPGAFDRCNEVDDDCDGALDEDGALEWYADADADGYGDAATAVTTCSPPRGYVEFAGDCDDLLDAVYPGADEVCDEIDDDCDGEIDEEAIDAIVYHLDFDEDGYGDPAISRAFCSPPPAGVLNEDDCDDADAAVNPDADEVCNEVDDDCDGAVDESPVDGGTYYADADGDGFGNEALSVIACAAPDGFVVGDTDCDDTRLAVNPDALELCATAFDDDCDGEVNELDASDATTFFPDEDGDGFGADDLAYTACVGSPGDVLEGGDCEDAYVYVYPGAPEICDGRANDCDVVATWAPVTEAGLVTFTAPGDKPTNIPFSGSVTLKRGRYDLCSGTYAVNLRGGLFGPTELIGHGNQDVVLDGNGLGPVLDVNGSTVSASFVAFVNGVNGGNGGGVRVDVGALTLDRCMIADGLSYADGGGLWVGGLGQATVIDTAINGGEAVRGGGVAVAGTLTLRGGFVTTSVASQAGGGVYAFDTSSLTVDSAEVRGNQAPQGGGVRIAGGTHELLNLIATENVATGSGGGVSAFVGAFDHLTLEGFEAVDNKAGIDGGGLFADVDGALSLVASSFDGNGAGRDGGNVALLGTPGRTIDLPDVTVQFGTAGRDGGGLWMRDGQLRAGLLRVDGNEAVGAGGGLFLAAGRFELTSPRISSNAASFGGGVYASGGDLVLDGGDVEQNTANQGGGLVADQATTTLDGVKVWQNEAVDGAGLFVATTNAAPTAVVGGSIVAGNVATGRGGGLYLASGQADCGDGVAADVVGFFGNSAGGAGGGVFLEGTSMVSRFRGFSCDLGTFDPTDTSNDNLVGVPGRDVGLQAGASTTYTFEDDASFLCTSSVGCF